jgi:hypothetical protein
MTLAVNIKKMEVRLMDILACGAECKLRKE